MVSIQSEKQPALNVVARSRSIAGNSLIGVGVIVLALIAEPVAVFGGGPAKDFIAVTRPSSDLAATQQSALVQPVVSSEGRANGCQWARRLASDTEMK